MITADQVREQTPVTPPVTPEEQPSPSIIRVRLPISTAGAMDDSGVPAVAAADDVPELHELRTARRDIVRIVIRGAVYASLAGTAFGLHFLLEHWPFPGTVLLRWISIGATTLVGLVLAIRDIYAEVRHLKD